MNKSLFRQSVTLAIAAAVTLAACGGSDDSSSRQRNAALDVSTNRVGTLFTAVSANAQVSHALDENGRLYTWGSNAFEQLDQPSLRDGATRFTDVVSGIHTSYALDDLGQIYAWGYGGDAQKKLPSLRNGASRFVKIARSAYAPFALDDKGQLYSWGWTFPQLSTIPNLRNGGTKFTDVSAGLYFALALDDKGNLYTWGQTDPSVVNSPPSLRDGGTAFTSVAAGYTFASALDDKGNLYTWGTTPRDSSAPPELRDGGTRFQTIDAGLTFSVALDDKGNLYAWGKNNEGQLDTPELMGGASRFVGARAGFEHGMAVDDKGNLYAWGANEFDKSTIPSSLAGGVSRSMPVAMGGLTAYGLDDTGMFTTFAGPNWVLENNTYVSLAAGPRHGLAITRSGIVEGWGDYEVGQLNIPDGLNGVVQVAAGYAYSAALKSNGTVVEWGAHTAPSGSFVAKPDNLPRVKLLASGLTHVLAVTLDGKVVGWGDNSAGKATAPENLDKVISAAANGYCSVALRENGDLAYWGSCQQSFSETMSLPGATTVAMAELAVAAIVNGQIVTWGEDANGLLAAPEGNNYVALSAGTAAFLAVTADGKVVTWGNNHGEPITIPESFGGPAPIVNDEICADCEVETQEFVLTDEMIEQDAAFYTALLTPAQQKTFIEALGGNTAKPLTPAEIQALVDAATAAERENSRKALEAALASPAPSTATALPASKSPLTKVGARVTTKKAVTLLGLKKVTKVSFVKPKKAITSCTVTATAVTAKSAGTCTVKVRYTDSKKKARTTTLTLSVG